MSVPSAGLPGPSAIVARMTVVVCCANLFAIVFLQRIVLPLGDLQASCLIPLAASSLLYLAVTHRAAIDLTKLCWFGVFLVAATASQAAGEYAFSVPSFLELLTIYSCWIFRIPLRRSEYLRILWFFQACMLSIIALMLLQYITQFMGLGMLTLEDFVPQAIIVRDFVYIQEISFGLGYLKPNALVMQEASFLSQFIAMALIVEELFFRRKLISILFIIALVMTFSGTGMILAGLFVPVVLRESATRLFLLVLTAAVIILAFVGFGWSDFILGRLGEFSEEGASAYVRFVAPFERILATLREGDLTVVLWGAGAGFVDRIRVNFAWNPWCKIWIEYGLVTFFVYIIFTAIAYFENPPSRIIAAALLVEYWFTGGGSLLQPSIVFGCFFLAIGYIEVGKRVSNYEPEVLGIPEPGESVA